MPKFLESHRNPLTAKQTWIWGGWVLAACQFTSICTGDLATAQTNSSPKLSANTPITKTLAISGTCLAIEEGTPIEGVELTLFEVTGPNEQIRELQRTTSNQAGGYAFEDVAPTNQSRISHRRYLLKAINSDRPDVVFDIRHNFDMHGFATHLRMHSGTGSIKGKVTDEKGNPLAGATVQRALPTQASEVGLKTRSRL
jgi:hypothetical protein